jgi:putative acetyltransferase
MAGVALVEVSSATDLRDVRSLFEEYARSLDFDLSFQGFERELEELPGRYARPSGRLYLARLEGEAAGCIASRRIGEGTCEMKRLFVRPAFQRRGLARALAGTLIAEMRAAGCAEMKLDTVPAMRAAVALYESLGFRDVAAYTENPIPGARFMGLPLR